MKAQAVSLTSKSPKALLVSLGGFIAVTAVSPWVFVWVVRQYAASGETGLLAESPQWVVGACVLMLALSVLGISFTMAKPKPRLLWRMAAIGMAYGAVAFLASVLIFGSQADVVVPI